MGFFAFGRRECRRIVMRLALAGSAAVAFAPPAEAFEYFDGKLQIHGAVEEQIRALSSNMSSQNNWDLAQWYNVLGVQVEYSATDSGWGPFDLLKFYGRLETRYDCVWTRACGIFPSVNWVGDRAAHEPLRMNDARRSGYQGSVFVGDTSLYSAEQIVPEVDPRTAAVGDPRTVATITSQNPHRPMQFSQLYRISGLFEVAGPDQQYGTADDPASFFFSNILDKCVFGSREMRGGDNGHWLQVLAPIDPKCKVESAGRLIFKPNPFSSLDPDPVLYGSVNPPVGAGELPFRPAPLLPAATGGPLTEARGVYYPSEAFRGKLAQSHYFDSFDENFSQSQLAWNHGASQQDTEELKELYADMEFLDSRLWIRLGKQNIVWGKTELFRTTDQFNPQDLALATLPELEESRIALWSVRGVYSFYSVGPLDDVRLEVAANIQHFEPSDIGRCGEPFTVFTACNKTTGLFFHGVTGFGLAGEHRPPSPWQDPSGLELGSRLEFRAGRFSIQISDFWGYDDLPFTNKIFDYSRSVDPFSGRPLRAGAKGSCPTGTESSCLGIYPFSGISADGTTQALSPAQQRDVLDHTTVNMQLFAMICATSIGFNPIDPAACAQTIFNSTKNPLTGVPYARNVAKNLGTLPLSGVLNNALAGNSRANGVLTALAGLPLPLVPLNVDPCDAYRAGGCPALGQAPVFDYGSHPSFVNPRTPTLNRSLTDQQEALLGCGSFYGTDCEVDGIDLANTETSVFMQSVIGAVGRLPALGFTTVNGMPQPGTVNFQGGPIGTRYVGNGRVVMLPGSRGPGDPGYDPRIDGTTTGLVIPASFGASAGQPFRSELAALSFNFEMIAAALSSPPDANNDLKPDGPSKPNEFDPKNPYSVRPGQCSWAQPQYCKVMQSFFLVVGQQRNSVRAGGSGGFGRTDFIWQSGGEAVLQYKKRNVLGFSTDFAEDVTKSNWSVESAWIHSEPFTDENQNDGISMSDTFNLTVSIDRPTFINFLNAQRTFFFNTQIFFQYVPGYKTGFTTNGPYNLLGTFTVNTGYYRDRLQPALTVVYDQQSSSGGILPKLTYRFTSNFSTTIGVNWFFGHQQMRPIPLMPIASVDNQVGHSAYEQGVENALAQVADRDEVFLRIRYTW